MAGTRGHKIISSKIEILEQQRNNLQTFVYETNKVIQLATSWLENEETTHNMTFVDINKEIENKLLFLGSTDFSVGCEETTTEQESVAARSFPPASKSTDQPLPAGYGHASGVPVASDETKTILSQVSVMQDTMSFLSSSSKNLSDKQLAMEKLVESMSDKYSKMEQEKLREIERELESIKEKQKKTSLQQDQRMTNFEKKIQEVTDSQSDIIENCHHQTVKIREHKKENEQLKTQSQQFTKDMINALENIQELDSRISVLENQTVNSTQFKACIGFLEERLENQSLRLQEHDSSLKEFTRREEETLNRQKCELEKLEKFEAKLSVLEKSWSETSVENQKSCRDVETKYEMVCQAVADRLVPLERLRDILNEKLDARTEHIKKLDSVCVELGVLQSEFSKIEQQTQRPAIGFTASLDRFSATENALTFSLIKANIGNHFDPTTGDFTAPLDGLSGMSLSLHVGGEGELNVSIKKLPCVCTFSCWICRIGGVYNQGLNDSSLSNFVLIELKAGERVGLASFPMGNDIQLSFPSTFSCFRIC